ncbi:MAG: His/Gly/Thr/Pro-type tRNA ligase C-terminal domain-containing protein, partial [Erysipelotrichaceae bacterium]|nr:His/Gly/Thr/Pro-type tRNA ligase C-terminal domain-containing protein [Erysipelotrichaceae bacterium]
GGQDSAGVGFAFGLERMMIAIGDELGDDDGLDVYVMPLGEAALDLAVQIAAMLRANGFKTDLDYQQRSMKGQFKSVDRFNAKFALILGESELAKEVVIVKNNATKQQSEVDLGDIVKYLENEIAAGEHHHE